MLEKYRFQFGPQSTRIPNFLSSSIPTYIYHIDPSHPFHSKDEQSSKLMLLARNLLLMRSARLTILALLNSNHHAKYEFQYYNASTWK